MEVCRIGRLSFVARQRVSWPSSSGLSRMLRPGYGTGAPTSGPSLGRTGPGATAGSWRRFAGGRPGSAGIRTSRPRRSRPIPRMISTGPRSFSEIGLSMSTALWWSGPTRGWGLVPRCLTGRGGPPGRTTEPDGSGSAPGPPTWACTLTTDARASQRADFTRTTAIRRGPGSRSRQLNSQRPGRPCSGSRDRLARASDRGAAEDGVAVVEHGRLAGGDAPGRLAQPDPQLILVSPGRRRVGLAVGA